MSGLVWVLRFALAAVLIFAGAVKLRDPTAFAGEIANYHLAEGLAPYLAVALPPIELILGLSLVLAPLAWRRAAALATFGLMAIFTIAVTQVVARGIDVSCGCFGGDSGPVTWWTVARDLVLVGIAAVLYAYETGLERRLAPRPPPPGSSAPR